MVLTSNGTPNALPVITHSVTVGTDITHSVHSTTTATLTTFTTVLIDKRATFEALGPVVDENVIITTSTTRSAATTSATLPQAYHGTSGWAQPVNYTGVGVWHPPAAFTTHPVSFSDTSTISAKSSATARSMSAPPMPDITVFDAGESVFGPPQSVRHSWYSEVASHTWDILQSSSVQVPPSSAPNELSSTLAFSTKTSTTIINTYGPSATSTDQHAQGGGHKGKGQTDSDVLPLAQLLRNDNLKKHKVYGAFLIPLDITEDLVDVAYADTLDKIAMVKHGADENVEELLSTATKPASPLVPASEPAPYSTTQGAPTSAIERTLSGSHSENPVTTMMELTTTTLTSTLTLSKQPGTLVTTTSANSSSTASSIRSEPFSSVARTLTTVAGSFSAFGTRTALASSMVGSSITEEASTHVIPTTDGPIGTFTTHNFQATASADNKGF